MQASFTQSKLPCGTKPGPLPARLRCVTAHAFNGKDVSRRTAAAFGAAMMIVSPFAGPAIARPSDFIQSRPGQDSTSATNEDKFPYNPSVSGNQARVDTKDQQSTQGTPTNFSNNSNLGDKNATNDKPLPSPIDTAPNPAKTGR